MELTSPLNMDLVLLKDIGVTIQLHGLVFQSPMLNSDKQLKKLVLHSLPPSSMVFSVWLIQPSLLPTLLQSSKLVGARINGKITHLPSSSPTHLVKLAAPLFWEVLIHNMLLDHSITTQLRCKCGGFSMLTQFPSMDKHSH